jgi:hypothetical protein
MFIALVFTTDTVRNASQETRAWSPTQPLLPASTGALSEFEYCLGEIRAPEVPAQSSVSAGLPPQRAMAPAYATGWEIGASLAAQFVRTCATVRSNSCVTPLADHSLGAAGSKG